MLGMRAPDFSQWLNLEPYGMEASKKSALLTGALRELTRWHAAQCQAYQRILALQGADSEAMTTLEQVPYLPARLFKEFDLLSIDRSEVFKTMTSSGTTEGQVSKIYLDRARSVVTTPSRVGEATASYAGGGLSRHGEGAMGLLSQRCSHIGIFAIWTGCDLRAEYLNEIGCACSRSLSRSPQRHTDLHLWIYVHAVAALGAATAAVGQGLADSFRYHSAWWGVEKVGRSGSGQRDIPSGPAVLCGGHEGCQLLWDGRANWSALHGV